MHSSPNILMALSFVPVSNGLAFTKRSDRFSVLLVDGGIITEETIDGSSNWLFLCLARTFCYGFFLSFPIIILPRMCYTSKNAHQMHCFQRPKMLIEDTLRCM